MQVCKWLVEAGVDAIHVSTGSFFPHPRNPAGVDLPVEELVQTYDMMISGGDAAFRTYNLFRNFPTLARRQWNDAAPKPDEIEGANLANARKIKAAVGVPVICTGGFQTASVIAAAIERGDCDMVSIAPAAASPTTTWCTSSRAGQDRADKPVHLLQQVPGQRHRASAGLLRRDPLPEPRGDDRRGHDRVRSAAVPRPTTRRARDGGCGDGLGRQPTMPWNAGSAGCCAIASGTSCRGCSRCSGWSRSATSCARRTCTTPRSRRSRSATSRPISIRRSARARSTDGTNNDLQYPADGMRSAAASAATCRSSTRVPTPPICWSRTRASVSRELMTREQFQPATILNLLAASWIQFMVHDWFVHKRSKTDAHRHPDRRRATTGARRRCACRGRCPNRRRPGRRGRRPTPTSTATGGMRSQIYGCDREMAREAAHQHRRQAAHRADRAAAGRSRDRRALQPASPTTGGSAWRCSTRSSRWSTTTSATCSRSSTRTGTTSSCIGKAKLINSALMAKIHTVEWTPAIVPHPIIKTGDERQLERPGRRGPAGRARSSSTTTSCSAASSARRPITTPRRTR